MRSISDKSEQLVKVAGKVPERLFSFKESVSRLSALQSDEGISPVRLLLSRARVRRMAQSPSSGGMDPMKRLLERSKDVVFSQLLSHDSSCSPCTSYSPQNGYLKIDTS